MDTILKKIKQKGEKNSKLLTILFLVFSIIFAIPSIIYYLKNKTIFGFKDYYFFLTNSIRTDFQAVIYIVILAVITFLYYLIIKNQEKIFKNIKEIIVFIALASLIFLVVIPFNCSDVFYYLGIGRLSSKYGQNPYYTTITEYVNNNQSQTEDDTIIMQSSINDWANTTVVYGPIWTLICSGVSGASFGNVDLGLMLFKILNLLIHLVNCYLIYILSKSKKFAIIYGLNPFMLLEGIMAVHNDIFVVLFILLGLYFLLNRKKILPAITMLAIASAIKYFSVILLPMFILYYFREEKISKRVIYCIKYGLIFIVIFLLPYLLYAQDINVFLGLVTQQGKLAKNFYIILKQYFEEVTPNIINDTNKILLIGFVIYYLCTWLRLLFEKKIKLNNLAREYEIIIALFIFLIITNFQPWYIMWLFPLFMWLKPKYIKLIIQLSILSQFANSIFIAYTESWKNGVPFTIIMITGTLICIILNNKGDYIERKSTKDI